MTNSLPNHCYYALNNQPIGDSDTFNLYSFETVYNLPVDEMDAANYKDSEGNIYATTLFTQTDVNNQLCEPNWGKSSRIDPEIEAWEYIGKQDGDDYTVETWKSNPTNDPEYPLLKLPNSDPVLGVARNGVFIFAGTSHLGYDAFYPAAYGAKKTPEALDVDVCLGTSASYNTYRYHSYSPCMYNIPLRTQA